MTQKLYVIVLSLLCSSWACELLKNNEEILAIFSKDARLCKSWEKFINAGSHPEWKELVLNNTADLEKIVLQNGAFKNVPNLENLYIQGLVNTIEAGVFKDLPNLKKLHLIDNVIEELPQGIFTGLNIEYLVIYNSQLKEIHPGTLDNIEVVYVDKSQFNPGTIFRNTNITILSLYNNSISKLENCAFCGMKNLETLDLQENSLTSFDPIKIFGEKSNIMGIILNHNKLTKIPKFDSLQNLRALFIANNSIEKIEDNSFVNCPKFRALLVGNNKLKEIPANIFPELENPFILEIQGNQIQCLSKELREKIKVLVSVTVNDNPWKCECLDDVISWAKNRKPSVGCELSTTCNVSCVDTNNKRRIISLPSN